MDIFNAIIVVLSNSVFVVGSYIIWPSRWNIPAHLQIGICLTSFLIPAFGTNVLTSASPALLNTYNLIQVIGSIAFIAGLLIGFHFVRRHRARPAVDPWINGTTDAQADIARRAKVVALIGIGGMILSFIAMGFVPMFASDPLAAKFFRGQYQDAYARVAVPFRGSFYLLVAVIPIALAVWYSRRDRLSLILAGVAVACITATLTRGVAIWGLLTFLGLLAAYHRKWFPWFILLVALAVPVGSMSYYFLGNAIGNDAMFKHYQGDSVWTLIASGSPDISDQLQLLEAFERRQQFTYGRTFVGALFPFHYEWNPAVWTLNTLNLRGSSDISGTISGGLRLPQSIWGYVSFGYIGAAALPLVNGVLTGVFVRIIRRRVGGPSPLVSMLALTLFANVYAQIIDFYMLSLYALPGIGATLWMARVGVSRTKSIVIQHNLPVSPSRAW